MAPSVKPEQDPGHVPTYAEWQAAQYGPHRFGQDPTAQMPMGRTPTYAEWQQLQQSPNPSALRFPALPTPKFVADQTKRLNPNAGAPDKSIPDQLGEHARHVAAGIDVLAGSTPGLPIEGYLGMKAAAAVTRQAVAPALENPAFTAATIGATAIPGVGPLVGAAFGVDMLHNVAKYGYQFVHEQMMSPEDRAIAQQDPNRISTEAAVVQIGMLGLMGLGAGHAFSKVADVSQGMTEAGAAALRPYVQSPVGATQLGAAAAEFGLPATANPYQPGSNTGAAWRDGYEKQRVQIPGTVEQTTPETPAVTAPASESTVPQRYNHEGKVAIVTPSAKEPGKWQATYFHDAEGTRPAGDIIADTPAAAIKALEQKGYSIPTKPKAVESLPEAVQAKYNKLADYESQLLDAKDSGDEWTASDETKLKSVQKRMRAIVAPEPATTAPAAAPPVTPEATAPTEPVIPPHDFTGAFKDRPTPQLANEFVTNVGDMSRGATDPNFVAGTKEQLAELRRRGQTDGDILYHFANRQAELGYSPGQQLAAVARFRKTFENLSNERLPAPAESPKGVPPVAEPTAPPAAPTEPIGATTTPTPSGLTPIEGTGETRTRGLATSTERMAVEADIAKEFGDLPQYQRVSKADQSEKALAFMARDPEAARRVALGEENPPEGLLGGSVYTAVRRQAINEGDAALVHDLITHGFAERATTMGQEISMLGERLPEDPVAAGRAINKLRSGGAKAGAAIKNAVKDMQKSVEPNLDELLAFFESMKC